MENSQSGTPKIDEKAISDFRKIVMPMIRRIVPTLLAQEIMGLGPPVCNDCYLIGSQHHDTERPWRCPRCKDFNLKGHLWSFTSETQTLIQYRTRLYESRIKSDMQIVKTIHRKFMIDDKEPNERYRAWLEENIGKQGEMWNWNILSTGAFDTLVIEFVNSEHATLFELTCP